MRYSRTWNKSNNCVDTVQLLMQTLLTQGCDAPWLKALLEKFYYRHLELLAKSCFFPISVDWCLSAITQHTFIRQDYMSIAGGFLQENGNIYLFLGLLPCSSTFLYMLCFYIFLFVVCLFLFACYFFFYCLFFLVSSGFSRVYVQNNSRSRPMDINNPVSSKCNLFSSCN